MNIHESIDRILTEETLGDMFYDTFLNRFPEVQKYFEGVNLQRQAAMLIMSLMVVEQFATERYSANVRYLRELGAKHRERGIPAETYPYFQEAMLDTLSRHLGDDWDDKLAAQWTKAIEEAIDQMLIAYRDDDTK